MFLINRLEFNFDESGIMDHDAIPNYDFAFLIFSHNSF